MNPPLALITGGAGFIGSNLAYRLLSLGEAVRIYDNLSRPQVRLNLDWLREKFPDRLDVRIGDVRDERSLRDAVRGVDGVFHLAAQVAVTTSLVEPALDFEVNALGTLNVLEAVRREGGAPYLFLTSTNKVYGTLTDLPLEKRTTRYEPVSEAVRVHGISEARPLDFHSPYGCSKGTADQYVLDYARSFGVRGVVFRMSCIYGPRQFGTEDQGWVAHFLNQMMRGREVVIYGDGLQVRDLLFVDDLMDAFLAARAARLAGCAFNIGGGPRHVLSLVELLRHAEAAFGYRPQVSFAPARAGDQRYYVSDTRRFACATGWQPQNDVTSGLAKLECWLSSRVARANAASNAVEERL